MRELGGRSGATVKTISVYNPDPGAHTYRQDTGESCWRTPIRVPPGGTLDTFYTDAGSGFLSYCYVGIGADTPNVSKLSIEVVFEDDEGVSGSATTTIASFRQVGDLH